MAAHAHRFLAAHLGGFLRLLVLGGLPLLVLGGCDNPACIFSANGCNGGTGGTVGGGGATFPVDGEMISPANPTVLSFFPAQGSIVDVHTPIVLVFSESMTPENSAATPPEDLKSAFELNTTNGLPIPFSDGVLTGDGRVLVLTTSVPLTPSTTFSILLKTGSVVVDRTGQELQAPATGVFGSFATPATPTTTPTVLAKWPQDHSTGQSQTSQVVVVFDRGIQASTVDISSFAVTVDGTTPTSNPAPAPVPLGTGDPRVFSWRSADGQGHPVELGPSADVTVTLSPLGHQIKATGGANLDAQHFGFTTAAFPAPVSATITSFPTDAIGIDQLTGPADLAVQVTLSGTLDGDFLALTMFGGSPGVGVDLPLVAIRREIPLGTASTSFTLTADEVDLLASASPLKARLADGTVGFAFQVRRGLVTSPVRMLDTDATEPGVQSPLLDTLPPHVVGLGVSGTSLATLRSDLRDLVLFGRANERLTKALVTTVLGDNEITSGVVPPVVGSQDDGTFIAAPIRLGVLAPTDLPVDFTLTIFDRAGNRGVVQSSVSDATDGFRQLGASGPGTALPGGNVTVEVFDAATFAPVAGAEVYVHQEHRGSVEAVNTVPVLTGATGVATLAAGPNGITLVTVRKTGYELFTFQGVPTSRLGIPLSTAGQLPGSVTGTVGPVDDSEASDLNTYSRSATDSRRLETGAVLFPVASCSVGSDPSSFECPFGPISVRPGRLGAQTAVTVRFPSSEAFYAALTFLKTGSLALPLPSVAAGGTSVTNVPVPFLLDDGTIDPEELPVDAPAQLLSTAAWPNLVGAPVVTIEASSPGLAAAVTVGQGVAFDDSPPIGSWTVRAAYPGSADGIQDFPGDRLGRLVIDGTLDPDLFLGVSVADAAGNRADARPRFSNLTGVLEPPATPVLPATPITTNPGREALDFTFPDVLPDSVSPPGRGMYRLRLTDPAGRSWTVFAADPADSDGPNVVVHLPDLGGIFPLASGSSQCRISGWSVPGFDLSRFLWTDLAREHEVSFHTASLPVSLP